MDTMTTRERFQAVMNFEPFDRLPILEWAGWWHKTTDRWHEEGLPADVNGLDINRHFDMDIYLQGWLPLRKDGCPGAPRHGAAVIEGEKGYDDILPHLYRWPVIDPEMWTEWAARQQRGEVVIWMTFEGFFWYPRTLLGIEPHLFAFYDQPRLIHRMNEDLVAWQLKVIDELYKYCTPDFMTFAEDMSYNHGPMLSESLFDEFMAPYYRAVVPELKSRGTLCLVDTDGDVTCPAKWFRRVGIEGILPLERQAGVDVGGLRSEHADLRMVGAFDKTIMHRGEQALRTEFERLLPTAARGGLIIACDHQTPPGVSYQDYQLYVRLFREYAARAGEMSQSCLTTPNHPTKR